MILGNVELPLVGEDHPATINETGNTGLYKLFTLIFRAKHVVPTIYGRPNVALGLPSGEGDWVTHFRSPYIQHLSAHACVGVDHMAAIGVQRFIKSGLS